MRLGVTTLRVAGAAGAVCATAASALVVAADTHPASAPLRPPVSSVGLSATPAADAAGLVIPPTATCAGEGSAVGGRARPTLPPIPPAIATAVAQLRAAKTAADKQIILQQLPADQRMQVTAYLQLVAQTAGQGRSRGGQTSGGLAGLSCLGAESAPGVAPGGAVPLSPSVVAGQSGGPVVVSAVS